MVRHSSHLGTQPSQILGSLCLQTAAFYFWQPSAPKTAFDICLAFRIAAVHTGTLTPPTFSQCKRNYKLVARKILCANQVLYGCQAGSKRDFKRFYLVSMRDLKLFRVYGLKRVLSRLYPALRRVLYVHNRVLYGIKHCYARPF